MDDSAQKNDNKSINSKTQNIKLSNTVYTNNCTRNKSFPWNTTIDEQKLKGSTFNNINSRKSFLNN